VTHPDPVIIRRYSPEPLLSHPLRMLGDMLRDLGNSRELAWRLFIRDMSAQYRQSYLGYVWAFLPPLLSSLTFVFLNSQGLFSTGKTAVPYAAFAMIGTILWQVFVDSLNAPVNALLQAKSMLAKINFPRESILLSAILMVIFNFLIRLLLLAGILIHYRIGLSSSVTFFPVTVAALIAAGMALGLAVAPLGALYGDVAKSLPIVTSFWMLLTPVVYPAKSSGLAGWLATWNPVSPLIITARETLTGLPLAHLGIFSTILLGSLAMILFGWICFRIAMPHLIARMG